MKFTSSQFWGVEVEDGKHVKLSPPNQTLIHISQAALGESEKKDDRKDSVSLFLKCGDQHLVIGHLSPKTRPQLPLGLVFEKDFELYHNWKNGSVFFCGGYCRLPVSKLQSSGKLSSLPNIEKKDETIEEEPMSASANPAAMSVSKLQSSGKLSSLPNIEKKDETVAEEPMSLPALDIDTIRIILTRATMYSLACCRCVCKSWDVTIRTPYFATQRRTTRTNAASEYLVIIMMQDILYGVNLKVAEEIYSMRELPRRRELAPFTRMMFVGHGMMLLTTRFRDQCILYNPLRGDSMVLPPSTCSTFGLGYDQKTQHYKLCGLRLSREFDRVFANAYAAEVHVLGNTMWSQKECKQDVGWVFDILLDVEDQHSISADSISAYGDVHWRCKYHVLSFVTETEVFVHSHYPPDICNGGQIDMFKLGKDLALINTLIEYDFGETKSIWVLVDYENKRWEPFHQFKLPSICFGHRFLRNESVPRPTMCGSGILFDITNIYFAKGGSNYWEDIPKLLHLDTTTRLFTLITGSELPEFVTGRKMASLEIDNLELQNHPSFTKNL